MVVNVSVTIAPVGYTLAYSPAITTQALAVIPVLLGALIALLHARHSAAATRGLRARGGIWTLSALAALVYPPLFWIGLSWGITQTTLIASTLMVLRRRTAITVVWLILLAAAVVSIHSYWGRGGIARLIFDVSAAVTFDAVVGLALYGAARLVRVLYELESAEAQLTEIAAGRERLRVSRDLHDLLGQSLSAVSLKGDLAVRLLDHDRPAARSEIQSLTAVARQALRGLSAVTHDQHVAKLRTETDGAVALLRAAGVSTAVEIELPGLAGPTEAVFAWAVREGVTNVLRHSQAQACEIRAGQRNGLAWLEIVNDGAAAPSPPGTGLTGLAARASAKSGSLATTHSADGSFRLYVELPVEEGT
jgi:two-component system sensor histidine kinase DesK